ncbi:DUF6753 family protein [Crocosphaera watsonii]|uniref:Permease of the drug/metabolite transporter (DMT) superfamily n=3 Tax=Crocosphaera watsonii TaxID=263511 RepID=T2JYA5_CROWT|nr:DUF6753 family protein [Crocosphaera watsonii]EHJ09245.1 hypothetical protein CWATWH0003_B327 [Crocosphaera watsonii WH 0003]CCQ56284.1 hypothetical protein CWATWH0005_5715 [Crocosphaera watsonii WH 0005]CCQ70016.1 Permease of the drug/metabolite transporter (DMT) superfamily [Crocosphaera watsonii WH 0402]
MIDFNKNTPNKTEETPNNDNQEVTTLLGELLENQDEEFVRKLMTIVFKLGLNPNDPMFVILGALGNLEFLIEQAPAALQQQFTEWRDDIGKLQAQEHKQAIANYKKDISNAVNELLNITDKRSSRSIRSLIPASAILLSTFCLGMFAGITVPPWVQGKLGGGYSNANHSQLTHNQVSALNWAMSNEGKYARQIMKWNQGYLGDNCEKDVQELGLKLSYGTQERSNGFCVVWVKPPGERAATP